MWNKSIVLCLLSLALTACIEQPYEQKTACEKENIIWSKVLNSEYNALPQWRGDESAPLVTRVFLQLLGITASAATDYLSTTLHWAADEFPVPAFLQAPRTKIIHSYGSVAKVQFVAANAQPFTGLYKGVPCGFVRLSLGGPPAGARITPGMGVKWLIDNQPSANFVSMFDLSPQQNSNFFENDFSNFLNPPSDPLVMVLSNVFKLVSVDPFKVDVSFMAKINAQGITATVVDAPIQLILKPNRAALHFASSAHEVRNDFHSIPQGSRLYSVYGKRKHAQTEVLIGDIVTKSRFVSSSYGDQQLFFRHERIDDKL